MNDAPTFEERIAALEWNVETLKKINEAQIATIGNLASSIAIMSQTDKDLLAGIQALTKK